MSDARLKQRELASRWGCSERRVRAMITEGRLSSFRLGVKLIRVSAKAVEKRMQEFRVVTYRGKFAAEYTENGKRHRQSLGTND